METKSKKGQKNTSFIEKVRIIEEEMPFETSQLIPKDTISANIFFVQIKTKL